MKIDVILLAGGASRRFASESTEADGKKLLAQFNEKPLFHYAFDAADAVQGSARILVVTREATIREEALRRGFFPVEAPPPDEGIAASVRAGATAARPDAALCFFVCDQPFFTGEWLCGFLEAYTQCGLPLGRVKAGSRMGSPTIFSPVFRKELLALCGDEGGRSLFKRFPSQTFFYEVPDRVLDDYDYPWKMQLSSKTHE